MGIVNSDSIVNNTHFAVGGYYLYTALVRIDIYHVHTIWRNYMCYAGGPYCPDVANDKLSESIKERAEYKGDNKDAIKSLEDKIKNDTFDYMTTTRGIKELKEKAKASGEERDADHAAFFAQLRKDKIAESKKNNGGQSVDSHTTAVAGNDSSDYTVGKKGGFVKPTSPIAEVNIAPFREPIIHADSPIYAVGYDFDDKYCNGDTNNPESDGICRDSTYNNVTVNEVTDHRQIVADMIKVDPRYVPSDLMRITRDELKLNKTDSYEIFIEDGYYGEEASVVLANPYSVNQRIKEYYFSRPDAVDRANILPYLRGKGHDTTGKQPLEAVKESLMLENGGKKIASVEKAQKVHQQSIPLDDVIIPKRSYYDKVSSVETVTPKNAPTIHGVVVKKGDSYRLVDGYHRFKGIFDKGTHEGQFIVLE